MKVIQITKESAMARFTMKIVTFITEILQYNNNYNSYMKVIQEHRNQLWPGLLRKCYFHYGDSTI